MVEGEAAFELGLQPKLLHGHGRLGQLAGGADEQAWCAEHACTHEAESDGDGEENGHLSEGVACHVAAVLAGGGQGVVVSARVRAPLTARALAAGGAVPVARALPVAAGTAGAVALVNGRRAIGVAPTSWTQGHGGEREAGARASHVVQVARLAAALRPGCGAVVGPRAAAALVGALGAAAFGGGADRTGGAHD